MIIVRRRALGWGWTSCRRRIVPAFYASAEHAMRDAWTWCGRDVPVLIYTRKAGT